MAINREHLKEYLAVTYPGPGVARQLDSILAFLLDQDEAAQQAALDGWAGEHKTQLQQQKAEADASSAAIQVKLDALK